MVIQVIMSIAQCYARARPPSFIFFSGRDTPGEDTSPESSPGSSLRVSSELEDPSSSLLLGEVVASRDILLALVPTLDLIGSKGIAMSKAGSASRPGRSLTRHHQPQSLSLCLLTFSKL